MLADIGGFELQPDSTYLDTVSREIRKSGGTIDKLVDRLMVVSWGVLAPDPHHAVNACRAALACRKLARLSGLTDDVGNRARVRIGIDSSDEQTCSGGGASRLTSTAMITSIAAIGRIQVINQQYGTDVTMTEATRLAAGREIIVRELDMVAVQGQQNVRVYELVAMADRANIEPNWVTLYHAGLEAYRKRRFETALGLFRMLLVVREGDRAARLMIDRCRQSIEATPDAMRQTAASMDSK
jgi:adenylate cyclase